MKIKVGDIVAARIKTGRVVEITSTKVIVEVSDPTADAGLRYVTMTKEQADLRGVTLEELVDQFLVKVSIEE